MEIVHKQKWDGAFIDLDQDRPNPTKQELAALADAAEAARDRRLEWLVEEKELRDEETEQGKADAYRRRRRQTKRANNGKFLKLFS